MVEREVLLAYDLAAVRRHDLADARVHHVRPDVVGGGEVEGPRPGLTHQPRDERVDLLRGHRPGAEDQRVGLLPLVLLGVDVERLALHHDRPLDRLPGGAVDAAEDDVDLVLLDELPGDLGRDLVVRGAVFEVQLEGALSRPPFALMSPMTILATLALASPIIESGPVWSAMTPTLMGSSPGDEAMVPPLL